MQDIYITSDSHFNHTNIIKYCNRPFMDVNDMNESLVYSWNERVRPNDIIYHLGDFGFGEACKKIFNRLNGQKCLIIGNHDRKDTFDYGWGWVKDVYSLKVDGQNIWLSHYPHRSWPKSFHGSWHLFGHVHGRMEPCGLSFDVGVDAWNFWPVSYEQIKNKILYLKEHGEVGSYVKR
jgi:calcineurin-like phosphoesterase family protein